jgi:hypothetical protein
MCSLNKLALTIAIKRYKSYFFYLPNILTTIENLGIENIVTIGICTLISENGYDPFQFLCTAIKP